MYLNCMVCWYVCSLKEKHKYRQTAGRTDRQTIIAPRQYRPLLLFRWRVFEPNRRLYCFACACSISPTFLSPPHLFLWLARSRFRFPSSFCHLSFSSFHPLTLILLMYPVIRALIVFADLWSTVTFNCMPCHLSVAVHASVVSSSSIGYVWRNLALSTVERTHFLCRPIRINFGSYIYNYIYIYLFIYIY